MTRPADGEAAGAERVDGQLGVVEGAEPGGDHDDHLDLGHRVEERREVEQGAAVGVQPDQQPAGALDDHGVLR